MSDIVDRLRASVRMGAVNGDDNERAVCESQMMEAAYEIERLWAKLEQTVENLEDRIQSQAAEIERLRDENDRLRDEIYRIDALLVDAQKTLEE